MLFALSKHNRENTDFSNYENANSLVLIVSKNESGAIV